MENELIENHKRYLERIALYRQYGYDIEEERNSAFVAVTRAKRWIYITYPRLRKMPWGDSKVQQPSRFVREMEG